MSKSKEPSAITMISGDSAEQESLTQTDEPVYGQTLLAALEAAWQALQTTPSYVEQQLTSHRGLIESIASQRYL